MNKIKIFWNNCTKDQKAVLVSTSLMVGLVLLGFATFIKSRGDALIMLPLQGLITWLVGTIMCGKIDKISKKKLMPIGKGLLAISAILTSLIVPVIILTPQDFVFRPLILLLPLFITRAIVFHFKLPLLVLYVAWKPGKMAPNVGIRKTIDTGSTCKDPSYNWSRSPGGITRLW